MKALNNESKLRIKTSVCSKEDGFTLIELLYAISIIGILSVMMWGAFYVYKENAEYAKAEATLRNARTAMEVGDQEASEGMAVGLSFSEVDGGPVEGDLQVMLPGATVSPDVRLGAMYFNCTPEDGMAISQMIIAQPCKANRYISWTKFCNGLEVQQNNIEMDEGVC